MTLEAIHSFENVTDTSIGYEEKLLIDRERLAGELGILSINLANANRAYSNCIEQLIKTNEEITRLGLKDEAENRLRTIAVPHELMLSTEL
jgi:hypothetical protein